MNGEQDARTALDETLAALPPGVFAGALRDLVVDVLAECDDHPDLDLWSEWLEYAPDDQARDRARELVGALADILKLGDGSPDGRRTERWLRRWVRRLRGGAPRVLWTDPGGELTLRVAYEVRGTARLAGALSPRLRRCLVTLPPGAGHPLVNIELPRAGTPLVAAFDLMAGRSLPEAFPGLVPLYTAAFAVGELARDVDELRRYLGPSFGLGPLSPHLVWVCGRHLRPHHLGVAAALRDRPQQPVPASRAPEEAGGAVVPSEANDVFHLAAFFASVVAGVPPLDATAGRTLDAGRLASHMPAALAETLRRCTLPPAERASLGELAEALAQVEYAQRPAEDLADENARLDELDAAVRIEGRALAERLLADGVRDLAELEHRCWDELAHRHRDAGELVHLLLRDRIFDIAHEPFYAALRREAGEAAGARERLDRALATLRKAGVKVMAGRGPSVRHVVRDFLDSLPDAKGKRPRGWVAFSTEETRRCSELGVLRLSFGATSGRAADGCAIGGELVRALQSEGLQPAWSGFRADTVDLRGFVWKAPARKAGGRGA